MTDGITLHHRSHIDIRQFLLSENIFLKIEPPRTVTLAATNILKSASTSMKYMKLTSIRKIVDRVHTHVCVHAYFPES